MAFIKNEKGIIPVYEFESFIPCEKVPFPDNRILDFLTVGPFVLRTHGSFEAEHMYEREKILNHDYLIPDGGEKNIVPVLGEKVTNKYYGDEYLYWKKGFIKWNCLRFDNDEDACDPALYATQQRNAVYYAAFYINCKQEASAVICYENSGSALFVNGKQADFRPFGRVKGLWGLGYQCLISLKKGLNLIMFKIRPGYIADSMDIAMSDCSVFPVMLSADGLNLTTPSVTAAYTGKKGAEKQVFPLFVAAENDTKECTVDYTFGKITLPVMKKGEVKPLRFEIPAEKEQVHKTPVKLENTSEYYFFPVTPYDGYEGHEHIYSDFHFDTTYHQEQRTYALGAFHITKCIIERLISNPDFKATLSEIDYLHPYYSLYPAHRNALKQFFKEGTAEADCFYNQPNDLTSSGEAFVRNLVYGQLYHRDILGRMNTVYQPGDVFGHFSQITQVCKKGGCDYIKWSKLMMGVDSLFRHVSPDGTSLLHDKGMNRTTASRFGVTGCDASSSVLSYIETYPREGDTSWMKNTVSDASFSVFSDLAKNVNQSVKENIKNGEKNLPDYCSRDITQHHSGVILTRTDFKQANRLCENLLVTAEKFASVAFMYGASYPDKALDKAQRQLLCAQHHDSITGTNNEISFVDLMIEYRECAYLLADIIEKACSFIAGGIKTEKREECVFVFNPLPFERGGKCYFNVPSAFGDEKNAVLTDTKGKEYPAVITGKTGSFVAEKLPAMGYSVFRIKKSAPLTIVKGNDTVIENSKFRIETDPLRGGTIISLYDKKEKKELIDKSAPAPGNTVYVLKEIHDRMETQHELYTTGHKMLSSDYDAKIESEKCALYQKLKIKVKLDTVANLIQEITLYKNSDTIDFRTVVEDYQSEDDLFTVTFPTSIKGGAVVFDDRFSPHVSTRSKKYMSFQTHQYASFSGCRVLPANRWFGISPTVTAYIGKDSSFNFGMTAVIREEKKDVMNISDRILFALTKKAVPVTLYSDKEQHGGMKIIHYNEDVYSTDTRIVVSLAEDKNEYKEKILSSLNKKDLDKYTRNLEKQGISLVYLKDNDNIYKKDIDVILVTGATIKALEKFTADLEAALSSGYKLYFNDAVCLSSPGKADEYGIALINNGTPASSVEGKGTLNMMLFHTASFYGNMGKVTGGKEMVPEQKTHIFTYALYPHKGSYREGGVYNKADCFNDPPFALTDVKERENTSLPEEKAFLKVPSSFTLTAFKAKGYPYANLTDSSLSSAKRGFTLRGFENEGIQNKITVKTGFDIFGASSTDLLDENAVPLKAGQDSISFTASPHSIETALIKVPDISAAGKGEIGRNTEITEDVYIRSWEHDMGSMPMSNLTFIATVERLPEKNSAEKNLYINAVNNSQSLDISAEIEVVCSEGIIPEENTLQVNIEKGGFRRIPLKINLASIDTEGQIKIFYNFDGIRFYDVYEIGCFEPSVGMQIKENEIVCTLKNPTKEILHTSLYIASPFETWGSILPEENRLGEIKDFARSQVLSPFEEREIIIPFTVKDEFMPSFWTAAKLACNGRVYFAFDSKKGERHNVWAHEFYAEIMKNNGSIKKILEM